MATNNMIITTGHSSSHDGSDDVHCPFPGPHSQPYSYSGYTANCLGKAHVLCGTACVVLEVLGLGVDLDNHRAAPGIWCGLLFICAGVISIMCGKRNTKDWIKSSLVATIIATIFTMGPLINCSLVDGHAGGAAFLCWLLMAATTAELIVAMSNVVICTSAIWPQYFQLVGIQMMQSAPAQRTPGRVPDTFQVMYVPPTTEPDCPPLGVATHGSSNQPYHQGASTSHSYHPPPQSLCVEPGDTGLRPPVVTCVVIPPTPSPPPGTDDDSPTTIVNRDFTQT